MPNNADFARSYSDGATGSAYSEKETVKNGVDGEKLLKWFADSYRATAAWREKAVESLRMLNNDQWDEAILQQLPQNMAPIVINMMLMKILYVSGIQRQTRNEPKIVSASGANPRLAEIMDTLVHWVETQQHADEIDSNVFIDKISTGLGWWKLGIEYECDDIEGEITPMRRPSLAVFPDPNFFDSRWEDAQYVIDTEFMGVDEASEKWPDYADEFKNTAGEWLKTQYGDPSAGGVTAGVYAGDPLSMDRMWFDEKTKRVRIAEVWWKETKKQDIAISPAAPEDPIVHPDQVKQIKAAIKQNPMLAEQYLIFKKPMTVVHVAHLFHDKVLDTDVTPYENCLDQFPLFPSLGYSFWGAQPFGLAELMKDLQKEKNKRRSKLIELVSRMPLSGFLNKDGDGADTKQLEEYASGNGVIISYKNEPPVPIRPPDLPMALVRLEDAATNEMKEVTNVHDEMLGNATQKTISGAAIQARQRGGFISQESLFDSFRIEQERRIRFEIEMIKQFMSPAKVLRILGNAAIQGNQQMDQMLGQAMQDPVAAQDVMQVLSDAFDIEYDVVITQRPTEPSLNQQAWQTLSDLKQAGAEIPPQTLWTAAQRAGILTNEQVQEIMQYIQQRQAPPPAPPDGPPPPGAPPSGMQPPPTNRPTQQPPPQPPPQQ